MAVHSVLNHDDPIMYSKLDIRNAFNSLCSNKMLESVCTTSPQLFPLVSASYFTPQQFLGDKSIQSAEVFSREGDYVPHAVLTIHPVVRKLESDFNVFYLDDVS